MRDTAQFFRVLADPTRLEMLWLLGHHRELCVCDLMAALQITQSKASRHLSTLRHAELVTDRKAGLWSYYAFRSPADPFVRRHLDLLKASLAQRPEAAALLDKLRRWLETKNRGAVCATAKPMTAKRAQRAARQGATR